MNSNALAATDADLLAAIDRGIAAGTMIVVDDDFLARMAAEIDAPTVNTYRVWSRELVRGRTVTTHRDVQAPTEMAARELREAAGRDVFAVDLIA